MRRLYSLTLSLFTWLTISMSVNAQTSVLTESFDGTTFPPTGWTNTIISGPQAFNRVTTGTNPACTPHSGAGMAYYNIFSIVTGSAYLTTPAVTIPSGSFVKVWMYRDAGYASYNEGLRIHYNTSQTISGATLLATVYRANNMAPTVSTNGWYEYTFAIPTSGTIYMIFEGFSAFGNNMFIDDIDIYYMCSAPTALTASAVLQNSATLSWGAVPSSAGYEYVLDYTAANPSGAGTPTTATSLNFTGLNSGTTYYMHVRNKCASGATSSWVTISFVTPSAPVCSGVSGLTATPVISTVVNLAWNPSPASTGYVYVIDQSPNDPVAGYVPTPNSSVIVTGLTPMTNYYAHVRSVCASNLSGWMTVPFTTPQCEKPNNILFTGISDSTVDFLWSLMPNVQQYEYKVDLVPTGYTNPQNFIITSGISAHVSGLLPDTKYYVFLRSRCFSGADSSQWKIDSFVTKFTCGVPDLLVSGLGSLTPTGTWQAVPKAVAYEYAVTGTPATPAYGTELQNTAVTLNLPNDNSSQYLHVRTKCNSQFTFSSWATAALRTTGISSVAGDNMNIQVYPNPVKDILVIEVKELSKETTISLTDITGKVIRTLIVEGNKTMLNMEGMTPGMYLIRYSDVSHNQVLRISKK